MRSFVLALALFLGESASPAATGQAFAAEPRAENGSQKRLSDAQIKKLLIAESIAAYDGNCPCPYSRARNGSRCGKRSAYSREGGAAPLCYPNDVTVEMVQAYRDEHPEG
jgi:hypothetical protein